MLKESLRMSWQNIRANKMRSFLTILGIVIGVTAIIALITTVESATHEMTRQFSDLGAGKVSISVSGTALKSGLTEADLERLSALENVESLDPTVSFTRHVSNGQRLAEDITIEGRNAVYFQRTDDLISAGRGLTPMDMDRNSHVCVIDATLRAALYPGENPLGQTLIVGGQRFTIVGLLSDDSSDVMSVMFSSGDNGKVILPFQAAQRMIHSNSVTSLGVYIRDTDRTDETIDDMEGVLNAAFNYKDDAGGRYRHYEHDAGFRFRADHGDWPAQGAGRASENHSDAVSAGGCDAQPPGRHHRHFAGEFALPALCGMASGGLRAVHRRDSAGIPLLRHSGHHLWLGPRAQGFPVEPH